MAVDVGTSFACVRRVELARSCASSSRVWSPHRRNRGGVRPACFFIPIAAPIVPPLTIHLGNLVKREVSAVRKQPQILRRDVG